MIVERGNSVVERGNSVVEGGNLVDGRSPLLHILDMAVFIHCAVRTPRLRIIIRSQGRTAGKM